ncbi:MAG: methyltransferase, TIGR04325 family [Lachnospiraceae bacterium]|nr:methyltransferase, TIGR04325 family [Lachnospiraceae bacterium]MBD5483054.1 methyltransferase, TIGR04325 family [Lachnospiraceae bacterium]
MNLFGGKAKPVVEYTGNYKSFEDAKKDCTGYDGKAIFDKVSESTMKVLNGEAVYERDSYLFYEKAVNYNLMMYLYRLYAEDGFLRVCDWGGALGSSYLQHREMLDRLGCEWNIVEQPHYVKFGKENIHLPNLHFYEAVSDIPDECNCVLFSSVLQYLECAGEIAEEIAKRGPKQIIVERTPISGCHYIRVQTVHEPIYEGAYAACVYKEKELTDMFCRDGYSLIDSWHSLVDADEKIGKDKVEYKSFVFEK